MKYLYCFEYYYVQTYGKQYTNLNFTRYKFGPNTPQLNTAVAELNEEKIVNVFHAVLPNGRNFHGHELMNNCELTTHLILNYRPLRFTRIYIFAHAKIPPN
jgi:hypothetical protein